MRWSHPGGQQFAAALLREIQQGRHVALTLPDHVAQAEDTRQILQKVSRRSGRGLVFLGPPEARPIRQIAQECGLEHTYTVDDILSHDDCPELIVVDCLDTPPDIHETWMRTLARFGEATQTRAGRESTASLGLIVLTSPRQPPVQTDVRLARLDCWGQTSMVDVDYVIDEALSSMSVPDAERIWLKSLGRGLAGPQPEYLRSLLSERPERLSAVHELLNRDDRELLSSPRHAPWNRPEPPSDPVLRQRWAAGALDWRDEVGRVQSISLLKGHQDELARRVWMGQQRTIWPLLDSVHASLCQVIASRAPECWAERPEAANYEVGPLLDFLVGRKRSLGTIASKVLRVARAWRTIRNSLAHCEPVTLKQIEEAFKAWEVLAGC